MKQILLFCLILLAFVLPMDMEAQTCVPDPIFADSLPGPWPRPYDPATMLGGITDSACVGNFYEFPFTIVIPEEFLVPPNGPNVPLNFFVVDAVNNLPAGITYACNPPDCNFSSDDTLGCIVLYGTPAVAGTFDLLIEGRVNTSLGEIALDFPGLIAPGNYFLTVQDPVTGGCIVGTENVLNNYLTIENIPNPFSYQTQIEINSQLEDDMSFEVFDLIGNRVHSERVRLFNGKNLIPFDGSNLSNGIYMYSISNEAGSITQKMVISR